MVHSGAPIQQCKQMIKFQLDMIAPMRKRKFVFIKMLSIVDKDEVKLPPQDIRQLITRKRGNITRHDQTNENTNQ